MRAILARAGPRDSSATRPDCRRACRVIDDTDAVDFRQAHSKEWLGYFARLGYPTARPLAAGVEGAVYRLGEGMVAKVWRQRGVPELLLWQAFYADVAASGLPFATPVILRMEEVDEQAQCENGIEASAWTRYAR